MLNICTWWWGDKYDYKYVTRLARGLRQNLTQSFRMIVVTDQYRGRLGGKVDGVDDVVLIDAADWHLLKIKGCLARLRMFDGEWQARHEINGRLVCIDLDTIITGPLDPVFDRGELFCILQGANASNPCPYTGALMMLQCGVHRDVWDDFSLEAVQALPKTETEIPDDQGWLAHKLPGAAGWRAGENGVYAFMKPGWPTANGDLPHDARLVTFPGSRDPSQFWRTHPWIQKHWS